MEKEVAGTCTGATAMRDGTPLKGIFQTIWPVQPLRFIHRRRHEDSYAHGYSIHLVV